MGKNKGTPINASNFLSSNGIFVTCAKKAKIDASLWGEKSLNYYIYTLEAHLSSSINHMLLEQY